MKWNFWPKKKAANTRAYIDGFFYVTSEENVSSILESGIFADKDGEIALFDNQYIFHYEWPEGWGFSNARTDESEGYWCVDTLADRLARRVCQNGGRMALFFVRRAGLDRRPTSDCVYGDETRRFQYHASQKRISPQYIRPVEVRAVRERRKIDGVASDAMADEVREAIAKMKLPSIPMSINPEWL